MTHFHRWSVWSLPVRVGNSFGEQYRYCTRCGKMQSRTTDCAGDLEKVHAALLSVAKGPSGADRAAYLSTTREITRKILRDEVWQKLYGAEPGPRPETPRYSLPGALVRHETCSRCNTLMEPKLKHNSRFIGWVWRCPTCQK